MCVQTMAISLSVVPVQARQLSVESDMKPVVACLQSHGLTDRDIVKVTHFESRTLDSVQAEDLLWSLYLQQDVQAHWKSHPHAYVSL